MCIYVSVYAPITYAYMCMCVSLCVYVSRVCVYVCIHMCLPMCVYIYNLPQLSLRRVLVNHRGKACCLECWVAAHVTPSVRKEEIDGAGAHVDFSSVPAQDIRHGLPSSTEPS